MLCVDLWGDSVWLKKVGEKCVVLMCWLIFLVRTWLHQWVLSPDEDPRYSSLLSSSSLTLLYLRCRLLFTGICSSLIKMPRFTRAPSCTCTSHCPIRLPILGSISVLAAVGRCCTPECWILRVSLSVENNLQSHLCTPKLLCKAKYTWITSKFFRY